jgi:hypothetical protein
MMERYLPLTDNKHLLRLILLYTPARQCSSSYVGIRGQAGLDELIPRLAQPGRLTGLTLGAFLKRRCSLSSHADRRRKLLEAQFGALFCNLSPLCMTAVG